MMQEMALNGSGLCPVAGLFTIDTETLAFIIAALKLHLRCGKE
jgi:hypothetical protein